MKGREGEAIMRRNRPLPAQGAPVLLVVCASIILTIVIAVPGSAQESLVERIASFDVVWKKVVGHPEDKSFLAADSRAVYLGSVDGKLYAVDALAGKVLWSFTSGGPIVFMKPALSPEGDTVYFGSHDGSFYAVGTADGGLQWKFATSGPINSPPIVGRNNVYFGSNDKMLYCLNRRTGALKWKFATRGMVTASPMLGRTSVMVGSEDGVLYALDSKGRKRWTFKTEKKIGSSQLAYLDGSVFLADERVLYALDEKDGSVRWRFSKTSNRWNAPFEWGAVAAQDGIVVATTGGLEVDAGLFGLSARSGALVWSREVKDMRLFNIRPSMLDGLIVVGDNQYFNGLPPAAAVFTGAFMTRKPPFHYGDKIVALELRTGRLAWECNSEDAWLGDAVTVDELLYFKLGEVLFALGPSASRHASEADGVPHLELAYSSTIGRMRLTKSSLSSIRSALNIFYSDAEGVWPSKLAALVPKYIGEIPAEPFTNSNKGHAKFTGKGGWFYNAASGELKLNLYGKDPRGEAYEDW